MKIFITGGTGFIGTHLIHRLKETQHELYYLARNDSKVETLKDVKLNMHGRNERVS